MKTKVRCFWGSGADEYLAEERAARDFVAPAAVLLTSSENEKHLDFFETREKSDRCAARQNYQIINF